MNWSADLKVRLGALEIDVGLRGSEQPLAIVGPNGSGKTTLLRVLAGAHPADSGHIRVGDRALLDPSRGIDVPSEQRKVGYVPQGYGLFPHLTALDNVAFGLSTGSAAQPKRDRRDVARRALDELGGGHLADRLPRHLSGGEMQRVALARALVMQPDLLLLDEPMAALDVSARRSVRTLLADHLQKLARPTVVVTHDVRDILALGARVCVLQRGRVVQQGTAEALRDAPTNEFVAEMFGPMTAA